MLFEARELGNPNHTKLNFVLAVLDGQLASDLELAADEAQPDAGFGDVQGMGQITVGLAGIFTAGDSHRQNCFGSVVTTAVIHFYSLQS